MRRYLLNQNLFAEVYLERILTDPDLCRQRTAPADAAERLQRLRHLWETCRGHLVVDVRETREAVRRTHAGLPAHLVPRPRVSESNVENGFIRGVFGDMLGYAITQNDTLCMPPELAAELPNPNRRPDLILFPSSEALQAALAEGTRDGARFCDGALLVADAKRFSKGIGLNEAPDPDAPAEPKARRAETTAAQDLRQVDMYLRGYGKPWGVLTNGRNWILMRPGDIRRHLRFDLVAFLEDLRGREPGPEDLATFRLFWHLFGLPAAGKGGYLDRLAAEAEAGTRNAREILRRHAHEAVERIALGLWRHPGNGFDGTRADQGQFDHLRELSLVLLYRLLFLLKAEAQNLLPMRDAAGSVTRYSQERSTDAVWQALRDNPPADRARSDNGFRRLRDLFDAVDRGDSLYAVPAYNGGLFDPDAHPELSRLSLLDDALHGALAALKYEDADAPAPMRPVPYQDMDVRDLGDIYEGLLEQRLVATPELDAVPFQLRNQKGERKASGSYFTPDRLVEHLVQRTLQPLLAEAGSDPLRVLSLRVVDPAMGSGHFLVKVVDVMADWLTRHCDPVDPGVPNDDGLEELAYWKAKVAENCIYGVDYNPMSVELAKVALWLHTAQRDKPLSFLDHHLKVGNSLVGAPLDRLNEPALRLKDGRKGATWIPKAKPEVEVVRASAPPGAGRARAVQQTLPFRLDLGLTRGVLASIFGILARPSDVTGQVKEKRREYLTLTQRLAAHQLLADLWCAQWFVAEPDADGQRRFEWVGGRPSLYDAVRRVCEENDDVFRLESLDALVRSEPFLDEVRRRRGEGYGPRPQAFFHWELEFPEVAFDAAGERREGFGFDAVVGNPPWDKIKPAKRDFYGPWSSEVANAQATSLDRLIRRLEASHPELVPGWMAYEKGLSRLADFLANSGLFRYQVAKVGGRRTGGDPDLFRYFVERSFQALRPGGRMGLVVPSTLWQAEGCTGLRQMLLDQGTIESVHGFENYRKWAFHIDSRFKFSTFVVARGAAPEGHRCEAAFMLRDTRVLDGFDRQRVLTLARGDVEALSPDTLALLDLKTDADRALVARLHARYPALATDAGGWLGPSAYARELDMTNDAGLFRSPAWMATRGFARARMERISDGTWVQRFPDPTACLDAERSWYPEDLPTGGDFWVAANADYYRRRGYVAVDGPDGPGTAFMHPDDRKQVGGKVTAEHFRILPGRVYTALYEGRMVHNFDHAQKAYLSGEGRQAQWGVLDAGAKRLAPRMFVNTDEARIVPKARAGFCAVTGATNERSTLACLLPPSCAAGNAVPTLTSKPVAEFPLVVVLNAFVFDWLLRFRVAANLNWQYLRVIPSPKRIAIDTPDLHRDVARLSCTTPEMAPYWEVAFPGEPWTYESAERDPWRRAEVRAGLDARVALAYGLTGPEYARVLASFPLLDRGQPALPGDAFLTECDEDTAKRLGASERGRRWTEVEGNFFEAKPRSFITRDLALKTFLELSGEGLPSQPLDDWFRDRVGLDPNGPLSRFRIGEVRDLEARVARARRLGAVAYVPAEAVGAAAGEDGEGVSDDDGNGEESAAREEYDPGVGP